MVDFAEDREEHASLLTSDGTANDDTTRSTINAETEDAIYVVRLRSDLQINEVTRLVHYVSDFGSGDVRGHALEGGWCLRLTRLSDLRLLAAQCPELIEGHFVEEDPKVLWEGRR
jgi:hypothetical protein